MACFIYKEVGFVGLADNPKIRGYEDFAIAEKLAELAGFGNERKTFGILQPNIDCRMVNVYHPRTVEIFKDLDTLKTAKGDISVFRVGEEGATRPVERFGISYNRQYVSAGHLLMLPSALSRDGQSTTIRQRMGQAVSRLKLV